MTDPAPEAITEEDREEHPIGTWALLAIYLVAIIVMWVWAYSLLIARG